MADVSPNPLAASSTGAIAVSGPAYEQLLAANVGYAMSEGSLFFEGQGRVQESLRRITARLEELQVPYAIVGGMALFLHGYRRFTDDVDLLVTPAGLQRVHEALEGLGYVPPFAQSKQLRDARSGVRIEFLVTGGYPGDGKPKPVAFPDPDAVFQWCGGVRVVNLPTLVTLKLASGMSAASRLKDLADVQELIKQLQLPLDFSDQLHPTVREKFQELWSGAQGAGDLA